MTSRALAPYRSWPRHRSALSSERFQSYKPSIPPAIARHVPAATALLSVQTPENVPEGTQDPPDPASVTLLKTP